MAVLNTYSQAGNREDLIDVVTRIAFEDTPFLSSLPKKRATGTYHEWVKETLDAPTDNAQVEGSTYTFGTLTPRTRLGNYCQISRKTGSVSETQEAVLKAGVKSEYQRQVEKAMKELARDMERALWQGSLNAGSATVARRLGGVMYWISTHRVVNSTATSVTGTAQAGAANTITVAIGQGATAAANTSHILITGGTGAGQYRRVTAVAGDVLTVNDNWNVVPDATSTYTLYNGGVALTDTSLNDAIQAARDAGGKVDKVFVDGKTKRAISGFAQGIRRVASDSKTLTASIDVYDSDFGPVNIQYDPWAPIGAPVCIDSKTWGLATLRPVKVEQTAKVGSSKDFAIEAEYTLEALGEEANAVVLAAA